MFIGLFSASLDRDNNIVFEFYKSIALFCNPYMQKMPV